jgi:glutamate racemase
LVYFGDGVNCPYGERTREQIVGFTLEAVGKLVERGAKLVVVACNTATAAAIDAVRERFPDIPIVGTLPAVKPAAAATKTGVVAVLATDRSIASGVLGEYIDKFAQGVEVVTAVGEGFVELVEQGREGSPEALEAVRRVVEPLIAHGADKLVLGCTHYPFLAEAIREVIGGREVEAVDSSEAVARRVAHLLDEHALAAEKGHKAEYAFHTLAGEEYLDRIRHFSE